MTFDQFPSECAKFLLGNAPADSDAMAVVLLLHTHSVTAHCRFADRPNATGFDAITQRDAASAVASAWLDRRSEKADYRCWYFRFNTETPFEIVADMAPEWAARVEQMRKRLEEHPLVAKVEPED
ncbi:MAG: hypothetical protein ABUS57_03580 [Pseudomonadota bacterium]